MQTYFHSFTNSCFQSSRIRFWLSVTSLQLLLESVDNPEKVNMQPDTNKRDVAQSFRSLHGYYVKEKVHDGDYNKNACDVDPNLAFMRAPLC